MLHLSLIINKDNARYYRGPGKLVSNILIAGFHHHNHIKYKRQ